MALHREHLLATARIPMPRTPGPTVGTFAGEDCGGSGHGSV